MKRAAFVPPWDDPRSEWRTSAECAFYMRKFTPEGGPDLQAAWTFLKAKVEKRDTCKRGRITLYRKAAVEAALGVQADRRVS